MVWTAPSNGIAMCHAGAVSDRQMEPPTWMLARSGSISPSLSFSSTASTLRGESCWRRRCAALLFSGRWSSCRPAWLGWKLARPRITGRGRSGRWANDGADAAAICEAVGRPHMRNIPIKTEEQQRVLILDRARDLLTRQRTMIINAIRAHLAEFGLVAAQGPRHVADLMERLGREENTVVPGSACFAHSGSDNLRPIVRPDVRRRPAAHEQIAQHRQHVLVTQLPGDNQRQAFAARLIGDRQDPELATVMGAALDRSPSSRHRAAMRSPGDSRSGRTASPERQCPP